MTVYQDAEADLIHKHGRCMVEEYCKELKLLQTSCWAVRGKQSLLTHPPLC